VRTGFAGVLRQSLKLPRGTLPAHVRRSVDGLAHVAAGDAVHPEAALWLQRGQCYALLLQHALFASHLHKQDDCQILSSLDSAALHEPDLP